MQAASSSAEKGGTWAGAVEALKSGKKPVFVRTQGNIPEGNRKLLEKGAIPFPPDPWDDLAERLSRAGPPQPAGGLFQEQMLIEEAQASYSPADGAAPAAPREGPSQPATTPAESAQPDSEYDAVLPLILSHLYQPRDAKSLAQLLDVRPAQLQDWLGRAVSEGLIVKQGKTAKTARYIVAPPRLDLATGE